MGLHGLYGAQPCSTAQLGLLTYAPTAAADCNLITNTCTRATIAINERVSYTFTSKATAAGSYSLTSQVTAAGDRNTANIQPKTLSVFVDQTCGKFNPDGSQYNCTKLADNYVFDNSRLTTLVDSSNAQATCCVSTSPARGYLDSYFAAVTICQ